MSIGRGVWVLCLVLFGLGLPVSSSAQDAAPAEPEVTTLPPTEEPPDPRYKERVVDFMWLEGSALWTDSFIFRVYPRHPKVGQDARIRLAIKRKREGKGKLAPEPIRVELRIRREAGGKMVSLVAESPGPKVGFEHAFSKPGKHVLSMVVHYSEEETYTVTMGVEVRKDP